MKDLTEIRNNYIWPKHDKACWKYLNVRLNTVKKITDFCNNKRIIIQAGGNAGLYVDLYSRLFDYVYSFEPEPLNFFCLTNNTKENVFKFQACLGNNKTFVRLQDNSGNSEKPNTGSYRVAGRGFIPTLSIDSFNFPLVDCIHLDIEGYELFALEGAVNTINKHKPVIALEINNLSSRYKYSTDFLINYLKNLNYEKVGEVYDDFIFKYVV